jgi:formate dehydrogenase subunit gamma
MVERFDLTERVVHWVTAGLMIWLIVSGAVLYVPALAVAVGHRATVEEWHVIGGVLLPFPVIVGFLLPSGRRLRADLARLNRWHHQDRPWWHHRTRDQVQLGKFNPGQKLNTAFVGGTVVVMLMTGLVMRFSAPFPISFATGATFVHDWLALAIAVTTLGHIAKAVSEPYALTSMVKGTTPRHWVRRHHPRWFAELTASGEAAGPPRDRKFPAGPAAAPPAEP